MSLFNFPIRILVGRKIRVIVVGSHPFAEQILLKIISLCTRFQQTEVLAPPNLRLKSQSLSPGRTPHPKFNEETPIFFNCFISLQMCLSLGAQFSWIHSNNTRLQILNDKKLMQTNCLIVFHADWQYAIRLN